MDIDSNFAFALLGVVGSGGVAWGGISVALRSTRLAAQELKTTLQEHVEADHTIQLEAVQRLTRIETKLDDLVKALGN